MCIPDPTDARFSRRILIGLRLFQRKPLSCLMHISKCHSFHRILCHGDLSVPPYPCYSSHPFTTFSLLPSHRFIRQADPFMSLGPIRRGWIHKKGEKNRAWKKRYLEVGKGIVKYSTKPVPPCVSNLSPHHLQGGEVKGIIQARDINNVDIDSSHKSRENIFLIETDNRTYAMQAPDAKMRSQWIDAISYFILQ